MDRFVRVALNNVAPIPSTLAAASSAGPMSATVSLAALFLHYYQDSYPGAPPRPDLSRFEYLDLVAPDAHFCLLQHVKSASTVKRRALSTELGQAFCRLMLDDHFEVGLFAHLSDVLDKPPHPAFGGLTVKRVAPGDTPDYLCSARHGRPYIAEAKGRYRAISFGSSEFSRWREQFDRIVVLDRRGRPRRIKGYIAATRLEIEDSRRPSCVHLEDPETPGEEPLDETDHLLFTRGVTALHYARVFRKLDLLPLASALSLGYALTRQLSLQLQVWTCLLPPFTGVEFVGGFYKTSEGRLPRLTQSGWDLSPELGAGHAVFLGLQRETAAAIAQAARGEWGQLIESTVTPPEGQVSSEFGWLRDGTVAAPLTYFLPTGQVTL